MYKTKKALSFFLAVCMLFTTFTTAFAASGTVVGEDFSKATQVDSSALERDTKLLVALGLLLGDNGGLRLNEKVTRAEVATLVCRILGQETMSQTSTVFSDVPSSHWASGYINYAYQRGIIAGYGVVNGVNTFGPEDNVTAEQATKMLVAAMGYNPQAQEEGGYPGGYLSVAAKLGITSGVTVRDFSTEALRETLVVLIGESLDKPLMVRKTYGSSEEYAPDNSKTLFSESLQKVKLTGTVTDNEFGGTASGVVKFNVKDNYNTAWGTKYKVGEEISLNVGSTDVATHIGRPVTVIVSHNSSSANSTVVYVAPASSNSIKSALNDIEIKKNAGTSGTTNYTLDYQVYGGNSNIKTATLSKKFETEGVYINGVGGHNINKVFKTDDSNTTNNVLQNLSVSSNLSGAYGTIEFFKGESESEYSSAVVTAYVNLLVDRVDSTAKIVYGKSGVQGPSLSEIDYSNADKTTLVIRDSSGSTVKPEDLKENDVLTVVVSENTSKSVFNAEVTRTTVSGTVSEWDATDNTITIGGKVYNVPNNVDKSLAANFKGITGTFFIDSLGSVVASSEETKSTENYALIAEDLQPSATSVKLFTTNGSTVTKTLAENARFNGKKISELGTGKKSPKGTLVYFEQDSSGKVTRLYDYTSSKLNVDKGAAICRDVPCASALPNPTITTAQFKKSGSSMWLTGASSVNENTVFFVNCDSTTTTNAASEFEVFKASDFSNNDTLKNVITYNANGKGEAAVVTMSSPGTTIGANKVGMIRTVTDSVVNSDGGSVPRFNFYNGSALVVEDASGFFWHWNTTSSAFKYEDDTHFNATNTGSEQTKVNSGVKAGTVVSYKQTANGEASKPMRLVGYDGKATDTNNKVYTTGSGNIAGTVPSHINTISAWKPTDELIQLVKEQDVNKAAYYFGEVKAKTNDRITATVLKYEGSSFVYKDEEFNLSGVTVWVHDPSKTSSNQVVKTTGASKIAVKGEVKTSGTGEAADITKSPQRVLVVTVDGKVSEVFTWIEN